MLLIVDSITKAKEAEKPTWGLKTSLALALSCLQPETLCASVFPRASVEVALQILRGFFLPPSPRPFKPGEAAPAIPYLQGHTLSPDAG